MTSEYFKGLTDKPKDRYLEKISLINGKDPYSLTKNEKSGDLHNLPDVMFGDIGKESSRRCSCLDGAVRLACTNDLEGYAGGSLLLVGSPKPDRPKGRCQTKKNTTRSKDRLLPNGAPVLG